MFEWVANLYCFELQGLSETVHAELWRESPHPSCSLWRPEIPVHYVWKKVWLISTLSLVNNSLYTIFFFLKRQTHSLWEKYLKTWKTTCSLLFPGSRSQRTCENIFTLTRGNDHTTAHSAQKVLSYVEVDNFSKNLKTKKIYIDVTLLGFQTSSDLKRHKKTRVHQVTLRY